MKIYDAESVINDVVNLFKAQLNTEITAINSEKNDSIVLDSIDTTTNYIFMSLDSSIKNFKTPWIQFGLKANPPTEVSTETFMEQVTVTIEAALFDEGEIDRKNTFYKLLRYQRAIKQVLLKNPDVFQGYSKPLMQSLEPAAFPLDSRLVILSMGVTITATITAN